MNFLPIDRAEDKRDPNVTQSPGWHQGLLLPREL